jgi:hypothetical protein
VSLHDREVEDSLSALRDRVSAISCVGVGSGSLQWTEEQLKQLEIGVVGAFARGVRQAGVAQFCLLSAVGANAAQASSSAMPIRRVGQAGSASWCRVRGGISNSATSVRPSSLKSSHPGSSWHEFIALRTISAQVDDSQDSSAGLKDRPSDFSAPLAIVNGVLRSHEIVLAQRPLNSQRVPCDIRSQ